MQKGRLLAGMSVLVLLCVALTGCGKFRNGIFGKKGGNGYAAKAETTRPDARKALSRMGY